MSHARLILIALTALAGYHFARKRRASVSKGEERLLLIGDSLAVGIGPHLRKVLEARGQGQWTLEVRAEEGTRAKQWAKRIGVILEQFRPTGVYISLGGNDLAGDPETVDKAIDSILGQIKNAEAIPLWIEPPKWKLPDPNGILDLWRQKAVYYPTREELDVPLGPDGIHPTPKGYAKIAEALIDEA